MIRLLKLVAAVSVFAVSSMAMADTVSYTGNTETSADGSYMRANAFFTAIDVDTVLYSVQAFSVGADGLYDITSVQGLDSNGIQFDGFAFIYSDIFNPLDPLSNGVAADDDGGGGAGTSDMLGVSLTAGTQYYFVMSAFDPAVTSFGSGAGPFENTISGPGDVLLGPIVPVPAAIWLMVSGLIGLGAMRRRNKS